MSRPGVLEVVFLLPDHRTIIVMMDVAVQQGQEVLVGNHRYEALAVAWELQPDGSDYRQLVTCHRPAKGTSTRVRPGWA